MGLLESLFYMMWRGIAIGVLVSAPMGPVGILCIQRTLDKGRRAGLFTGVGAALSDLFYCLLTGFGLSFIEEFIEKNQNVIQLIGSVVLIGFSVYLFKKNPARALKAHSEPKVSAKKNILGGFLFTFSNPLIILLIIGLFARFNFLMPDIQIYHYLVGFIFILVGALGWWWMVTFFIDKVRSHFNVRSMWLINKLIGVVILLFAIVGIITSIVSMSSPASAQTVRMNAARGYSGFKGSMSAGVRVVNMADTVALDLMEVREPVASFDFSARVANRHSHPSRRYSYTDSKGKKHGAILPSWGIAAVCGADTVYVEFKISESEKNAFDSSSVWQMRAANAQGACLNQAEIAEGCDFHGLNGLTLRRRGSQWQIFGGNRSSNLLLEFDYHADPTLAIGWEAMPGAEIEATDISFVPIASLVGEKLVADIDELVKAFPYSSDYREGIWRAYDRSLDESMLKMGGDYTVALRREGPGNFSVIYVSGAKVNSSLWRPGMLKGRLVASTYPDVFDVEWRDADGNFMSHDIKAQMESPSVLSIQFPYQNSSLRFRKVSNDLISQ